MNCKHVANLLSPLLDNELSPTETTQIQAHLNACPACATELADLQRITLLLQRDAAVPLSPLPDLYTAFQERLVTQPVASSFRRRQAFPLSPAWRWSRLAVGIVGAVCVTTIIWNKFFPYNAEERALLSAASTLTQYDRENSIYLNETRHFRDAHGNIRTRFFRTWWRKGYYYSLVSEQKSSITDKRRVQASDFVLSYGYGTPGGVTLQWQAEDRADKTVHLDWSPSDPAHPANNPLQYDAYRYAPWFEQIVHRGTTAQAKIKVGGTFPDTMQYRLNIGDLKAGLKRSDEPDDSREAPNALTLWFDAQGRLQHVQERPLAFGIPLPDDTLIEYPPDAIPQLATPENPSHGRSTLLIPHIPRNRPIVLAYKPARKNTPIPPQYLVNPIWLTMTEHEKDEVRGAVRMFAEAWRAHDTARLRNAVDLDRPLEITRPEKRAGLTREDVWQRVWLDHLLQQPQWASFAINVDFAFEAAPRQIDAVPLDAHDWTLDTTLPGLNVLGWINAYRADNSEYKVGARLYLVKRPTGWKVYQFGILHSSASSM